MRYYYEKPEKWTMDEGYILSFLHPLYKAATVYMDKEKKGIAVVQQRFNPLSKVFWWGSIDPWLVDDIASQILIIGSGDMRIVRTRMDYIQHSRLESLCMQ